MMMHFRNILCLVMLSFATQAWSSQNYSAVYVFGDSLSDTGNLAAYLESTGELPSGELPYPYYENRISNGSVAIDVLAKALGFTEPLLPSLKGGTNYATTGATAAGDTFADLQAQLSLFLQNHLENGVPVIPNDALYVIFIGGNDVRAARDELNSREARSIIQNAVNNIESTIRTLITLGAQHIMVVNSADIGAIPETQMIAETPGLGWVPLLASVRSKQFNFRLFLSLLKIEWLTHTRLMKVNLFKGLNEVIANAAALGFSNNSDACFSSVTLTFYEECLVFDPVAMMPVPQFDQFIFFDEIHPTSRVHGFLGELLVDALPDKSIETPKGVDMAIE